MNPHPHGMELVRWARDRLRQELGGPAAMAPSGPWCSERAATFVTLRWSDGRLQGCIGSLVARRSVVDDVAHNAIAAAIHDPRSVPVRLQDVDRLHFELSILSPLEPVVFEDERSALAAIRPGTDGIVFQWQDSCATFLPSMWPRLPRVREFMRELKMKAGLPPDFWAADVRLQRYTVDKHVDPAVGTP